MSQTITANNTFNPIPYLIGLVLLAIAAIMIYSSVMSCEFVGCHNVATTKMKSPITNEVRDYCDEHSVIKFHQGWKIIGKV